VTEEDERITVNKNRCGQKTAQRDIFEQAQRDRQAELDRMMAMQAAADRRQQEAMKMIAESSKAPFKVKTAAVCNYAIDAY